MPENCDEMGNTKNNQTGGTVILPLEADDLPEVMEIWLTVNQEVHDFVSASYWQANYAAVQRAIAEAEVYCWKPAETPVGFIGLIGDYVAGLFVRPEWRGHGVGRSLLALAQRKKPRLRLHVYRKNQSALAFYIRQGFAVTGSILEPVTGETALIMQWENKDYI